MGVGWVEAVNIAGSQNGFTYEDTKKANWQKATGRILRSQHQSDVIAKAELAVRMLWNYNLLVSDRSFYEGTDRARNRFVKKLTGFPNTISLTRYGRNNDGGWPAFVDRVGAEEFFL